MVKKIIVIGASAGGYKAVIRLVSKIPPERPAAIFIVIHLAKTSSANVITDHLEKKTSYRCCVASDQQSIQPGYIYVAPADMHIIVKPGIIRVLKGAAENLWRPSIDVLFRSAAAAYDSRVLGIILSGLLHDGTSGMSAIKRSGGVCIVQEPNDAEFTDMPLNVLKAVEVDHRVPVDDMGYIIDDFLSKPVEHHRVPDEIHLEAQITERMASSINELELLASPSHYTCPECGGNLWEIKNESSPRYRCHTGHCYSEKLLTELQDKKIEESLWVSIRMLEERRKLFKDMSDDFNASKARSAVHREKAEELNTHIDQLKSLIITLNKAD